MWQKSRWSAGPLVVCLVLLSPPAAGQTVATPPLSMRTIEPRPDDAVLFNPGMGLYLAGGSGLSYQPSADAWVFRMADIIYFRPVWSDLESTGPGSDFEAYFEPIFAYWVEKMGKRVAFRVMSESMHSRQQYATPQWVFEQGVPKVLHVGIRGQQQWDPVFWDPKYLQLNHEFVARLGKYLDGRRGLEFLDVGTIGEWGEMHLGLHIPGRWTSEQMAETGFTTSRYVAAYRSVIDAHAEAFPHTRVFLNVGDYAQINDYAAIRGLHFRQDGLTPSGPSADVGNRFYRPYAPRGVICNYEFHSGLASMRAKHWDLQATVDQGLDAPVSYLNTNVLSPQAWETAPEEVKAIFLDAARRVGCRLVLESVRTQQQIRVRTDRPSRLIISHQWKNQGIAPCYESYAIQFTLHDQAGQAVTRDVYFPTVPTTRWQPGQAVELHSVLPVAPGMPAGQYSLKVALVLPERPDDPPLRLGIQGADEDGRYTLCDFVAVTVPATDAVIVESFEQQPLRWSSAQGITIQLDQHQQHAGTSSMRIEGAQQRGWNYTAGPRDIPVMPGSKYRLTCWMKVDELEPASLVPYLKLGVHDQEGNWIANLTTTKYDLRNRGTWQQLAVTADTPLAAHDGQFAVERGGHTEPSRARIWLDDVRLEMLEGP